MYVITLVLQNKNREPRSRGACEANDSAYGNSGPSGVVSAVGSLFPRGTKVNVAAYGSGSGASCQRPGYQPRMVLRGSTNDGYPVLVLDRSGLAMITDRTFQVQVQAWKVGEVSVELRVSSFLRRSSLPLHVLENQRSQCVEQFFPYEPEGSNCCTVVHSLNQVNHVKSLAYGNDLSR
ncbi:hypothetical protein PIB30_085168 [Stylosanthes scabra]|uniref:Uncharacterized protein n=1 Tax=Stylosanthes scabra TaxID=79078 RepID=A0ABU6RTC7_9FABA|nr:hypothetical protein [Stylosanthes scabra]